MKDKIKLLQEIIKEGIGDRTRKAFAAEVGISAEHLSRMLKDGYSVEPSESLLMSLAISLPNTDLEELYGIFEISNKSKKKSLGESIAVIAREIIVSSNHILRNNRVFEKSDDFIQSVSRNVSLGKFNEAINILSIPCDASLKEFWSLQYDIEDFKAVLYFFIVTSRLETGAIIVSEFGYQDPFDGQVHLDSRWPYPYKTTILDTKKQIPEQYHTIERGFGFYITDAEAEVLENFRKEYAYHVTDKTQSLEGQVAEIMSNRSRMEISYITGINGSAFVVSKIRGGVVDELTDKIMKGYAKLLGIKKYGYISIISEANLKEDELNDVD